MFLQKQKHRNVCVLTKDVSKYHCDPRVTYLRRYRIINNTFSVMATTICAYHSSVSCFQGWQVSYDGSAEADVAFTNAPNYPKQQEHAEAPGNCPDRIGGHQA